MFPLKRNIFSHSFSSIHYTICDCEGGIMGACLNVEPNKTEWSGGKANILWVGECVCVYDIYITT